MSRAKQKNSAGVSPASNGLPPGWASATIGEICDLNPGLPDAPKPSTEISFVPMAAVSEHTGTIVSPQTRKFCEVSKGYTQFRDGDVIWAKITPCMENGKAAVAHNLINGIACGSTEFFVLRSTGAVLPEFIYKFIRQVSYRNAAARSMSGAVGQARVTKNFLLSTPFALPPLAEQRRIVARLEKLAARSRRARAALDDVPPLLAQARQSLLAAAFRGDLTKDWRKQNPTDARWNSSTVGDVVESVKYGTAVKCRYETKGTPVLRIPNIKDGAVSQQDLKFAKLDKRELESLSLEAGDVLIIRSNGSLSLVGCAALVSKADAGFAYAGYLIRLRPRRETVDSAFLTHMINSPIIRPQIDLAAHSTSGVNNINSEELRNLCFRLPPIAEQRQIVRRVRRALSRLDAAAAAHASAVAELDRLDQSLLARAFTGQLVPQNPHDEPSAKLLERIQHSRALKLKNLSSKLCR